MDSARTWIASDLTLCIAGDIGARTIKACEPCSGEHSK